MVSLNNRIAKNKKIPWRIVEGEAILVDVDKGEVIHLNPVGAEIWNSINGKKSVKEIIEHICNQFEVDKETAKEDTLKFLERLHEKDAIECLKIP